MKRVEDTEAIKHSRNVHFKSVSENQNEDKFEIEPSSIPSLNTKVDSFPWAKPLKVSQCFRPTDLVFNLSYSFSFCFISTLTFLCRNLKTVSFFELVPYCIKTLTQSKECSWSLTFFWKICFQRFGILSSVCFRTLASMFSVFGFGFTTFLLITTAIGPTDAIKVTSLVVPPHQKAGKPVQLECYYDLEGEVLYSVKWYRGSNEFFRYVPGDKKPMYVFDIPGVVVDTALSDQRKVTLRPVTRESSGSYKCEVSADYPTFHTVHKSADMLVVDFNSSVPNISGGQSRYHVGDEVHVNCTSAKSRPAASLMWYINDKQARSEELVEYAPVQDVDGLETSRLGLKFIVGAKDFPNGILKIRCTTTVAAVYWNSTEVAVEGQLPQTSPALESKGVYTVEDCRKRWKNIKNTFERKKIKNTDPAAPPANKSGKTRALEEKLLFLRSAEEHRKRFFSNFSAAENEKVIDDPEDAELRELDGDTSSLQKSEETPQSHSPSTSPFPQDISSQQSSTSKQGTTSNTSRRTNDRGKYFDSFEKRSAECNDLIKNLLSAEANVDEIDLFFQSISKSMKKLPPHLQHRGKMETLNTLGKLEAEMCP